MGAGFLFCSYTTSIPRRSLKYVARMRSKWCVAHTRSPVAEQTSGALSLPLPNGYRVESVPDLMRSHSTVARQNGWPGGV